MSDFLDIISFLHQTSFEFSNPNFFLEQYLTSIKILQSYYELFPKRNINFILDLGVGTGLLSFLAFKMGAKKILGIDIDRNSLHTAKRNFNNLKIPNVNLLLSAVEFLNFKKFQRKINGVIMNPPFGTKRKYLDFVFLNKAMDTNCWILTLHKNNIESEKKIGNLCIERNYSITSRKNLVYELPKTYTIHQHTFYPVNVILYLLNPNEVTF
jgi:putative methylase